MQSAEDIKARKDLISSGEVYELDESTKKLQQAYSKFKHKLKAASKDEGGLGTQGGGGRRHHWGGGGGHRRCLLFSLSWMQVHLKCYPYP